jgi:hypothetical protein
LGCLLLLLWIDLKLVQVGQLKFSDEAFVQNHIFASEDIWKSLLELLPKKE